MSSGAVPAVQSDQRHCTQCAYSLKGLPEATPCPECGHVSHGPQLIVRAAASATSLPSTGANLLSVLACFGGFYLLPTGMGLLALLIAFAVIASIAIGLPHLVEYLRGEGRVALWIFTPDRIITFAPIDTTAIPHRREYRLTPRFSFKPSSIFGQSRIVFTLSFWTVLYLDAPEEQILAITRALEQFRPQAAPTSRPPIH